MMMELQNVVSLGPRMELTIILAELWNSRLTIITSFKYTDYEVQRHVSWI